MKLASSPPWKQICPCDGAVGPKFGPTAGAGLVHFVVAVPGELNGIGVTRIVDGTGDAAEGELAAALAVEQNVSGLDHVGEVGLVVRHPDDAPLSLQAAAPRSLGRRIRLLAASATAASRPGVKQGNTEGAFDQTLCAAWVADDGSRPEQAKALRREANQYLVDRADWLVDLQLVRLDVLRRASYWQDAAALAAQLEADDLEYPLSAIVRFHSARIAVEDDSCHTIKEALDAAPVELPEGFREIPIIWEDSKAPCTAACPVAVGRSRIL